MDPEHAYITLCLFFSRVEKNQKTEGRGEKPDGEGARAAAERQNSLRLSGRTRCAQTLPLRDAAALRPLSPAFLRAPAIRTETAEARMAEPGISSNESITTREARRADIVVENIHFEKIIKKIHHAFHTFPTYYHLKNYLADFLDSQPPKSVVTLHREVTKRV